MRLSEKGNVLYREEVNTPTYYYPLEGWPPMDAQEVEDIASDFTESTLASQDAVENTLVPVPGGSV